MLNCDDHQLLLNSLQDLESKVRAARTAYTSMIAAGALPKPDENAPREVVKYPPPTAVGYWRINDNIDVRDFDEFEYVVSAFHTSFYNPKTNKMSGPVANLAAIKIRVRTLNGVRVLTIAHVNGMNNSIFYSNGSTEPDTLVYSGQGEYITAINRSSKGYETYGSTSKLSDDGVLIRSFEIGKVSTDNEAQPLWKVLENIATRIE